MSRVRGAASAQPTSCSSYFGLCGCYSLCLQKHALGLHTAQTGPKCPSNDRVRNAPSTQGPRHVPRAWHCFGKAYPLLFFLFWLCSCYSPCTERCPWSRGGTTFQSCTALLMHHGRPAFLPILLCYATRPRVPFKEAFPGMPPLDGVLACSACCCRLYRLKPLKPIDGGMEEPGPKHDPLPPEGRRGLWTDRDRETGTG